MKNKAVKRMRDVLDEDSEKEGPESQEHESSDEDGVIRMDFTSKNKTEK